MRVICIIFALFICTSKFPRCLEPSLITDKDGAGEINPRHEIDSEIKKLIAGVRTRKLDIKNSVDNIYALQNALALELGFPIIIVIGQAGKSSPANEWEIQKMAARQGSLEEILSGITYSGGGSLRMEYIDDIPVLVSSNMNQDRHHALLKTNAPFDDAGRHSVEDIINFLENDKTITDSYGDMSFITDLRIFKKKADVLAAKEDSLLSFMVKFGVAAKTQWIFVVDEDEGVPSLLMESLSW